MAWRPPGLAGGQHVVAGAAALSPHQAKGLLREGPVTQIMVPQDSVGMLIGKGGETIKFLQRESGARIEVSKTVEDSNADRPIYISGLPDCVEKAKRLIIEALKSASEASGTSDPDAHVIRVPGEFAGLLIGRGGESLKRMRKESGARIDVNKATDGQDPDDRIVHISGPLECVEYAQRLVKELLATARENDPENKNVRPTKVAVINVPEDMAGFIIGRGGAHIKELEKSTKTKITSSKDEEPGMRTLSIHGAATDVEEARRALEGRLESGERGGRGGKSGNSDRRDGLPPTKVITVSQDQLGPLIGRKGENIKDIERKTGCSISIPKDQGDGQQKVNLSGSYEACEQAAATIEDMLRSHGGRRRDRQDKPRPPVDWDKIEPGTLLNEKIYVDEVDLSYRPELWHEFEDGLSTDIEIFVRGLPDECTEQHLWEHICSFGAQDVREILMLRRRGKSKGMAYVVFHSHDSAVAARSKLHQLPASSLPCFKRQEESDDKVDEGPRLKAWFSESERCIKGRRSVYKQDLTRLILGENDAKVKHIQEETGLKRVAVSGAHMESWGIVNDDPRLHMVASYTAEEEDLVASAIRLWERQLENVHIELAEQKTQRAANNEEEAAGDGPAGAGADGHANDMSVTLQHADTGEEHVDEVLTGRYALDGENHERPVYKKRVNPHDRESATEVFIFFWDERDGPDLQGWWFGASVGGEEVWARNVCEDMEPPEKNWELIAERETVVILTVKPADKNRPRRKRRRHRRHAGQDEADPMVGNAGADADMEPAGDDAEVGRPPDPPEPWELVPHEGNFYYWNKETGESSWHAPPGSEPANADGEDVACEPSQEPEVGGQRHRRRHRGRRGSGSGAGQQGHRSRSRRRDKDAPPPPPPGYAPPGAFPMGPPHDRSHGFPPPAMPPPGYPPPPGGWSPHYMGPPGPHGHQPPAPHWGGYGHPGWEAYRGPADGRGAPPPPPDSSSGREHAGSSRRGR